MARIIASSCGEYGADETPARGYLVPLRLGPGGLLTKRAVVLLSGGLDSSTCLYWAQREGWDCEAVSVLYGQRHARELDGARAIAKAARVPWRSVELELPWLKVSSLVSKSAKLPDLPLAKIGTGGIPSTYVPARNTVLLAVAASLADATGASAIVTGANALDFSGYPDCRPAFHRAFESVLREGTRSGKIRVLAPLLRLDKEGIVRLALELGVPLGLTWSCYKGGRRPCGRCDSCKLRAKGFAEAQAIDPAC
ncbi:MAG: 7-cyano-7-deazaguanine synthase QueC [Elusimicrobia bacterium]|nr:7-cyano-7-deazaguanine synthase QueC [Elusimicrobiota bacterium]